MIIDDMTIEEKRSYQATLSCGWVETEYDSQEDYDAPETIRRNDDEDMPDSWLYMLSYRDFF